MDGGSIAAIIIACIGLVSSLGVAVFNYLTYRKKEDKLVFSQKDHDYFIKAFENAANTAVRLTLHANLASIVSNIQNYDTTSRNLILDVALELDLYSNTSICK